MLGEQQVLKNINLNVNRGSIFALIGPNGAGKTTLIRSLTGIYNVDKGDIRVKGKEVYENPEVKKVIGYVADENIYFSSFTVKEVIKFYSLAYDTFSKHRFNEINKIFQIPDKIAVRRLSKGMRTSFAIMLSLCIMPELLILDEPTSGLDPIIKKQVLNLLLEEVGERGTTIFISSHNLIDLERICDFVAIINKGEIKYSSSIEDMKKNIRKLQVVFIDKAPQDLKTWREILNLSQVGRVYNIITREYDDEFINKLENVGLALMEEIDLSLEDMFIYSVGEENVYGEVLKIKENLHE